MAAAPSDLRPRSWRPSDRERWPMAVRRLCVRRCVGPAREDRRMRASRSEWPARSSTPHPTQTAHALCYETGDPRSRDLVLSCPSHHLPPTADARVRTIAPNSPLLGCLLESTSPGADTIMEHHRGTQTGASNRQTYVLDQIEELRGAGVQGSFGRRLNLGPLRASRSRTGACFGPACSSQLPQATALRSCCAQRRRRAISLSMVSGRTAGH